VRQHHAWLTAGLVAPRIAVNVSAVQLADAYLLEDVADVLSAFPTDPGLDLEVTESAVMANVRAAVDTLRAIHDLGVEIALDDFGTGYSSLSYLQAFPLDCIKIDRSFVAAMETNSRTQDIVALIAAIARRLGARTVAEGVETQAQLDLVRAAGCERAQGYLFSRPRPIEELVISADPRITTQLVA